MKRRRDVVRFVPELSAFSVTDYAASIAAPPLACAACGAFATHTAPLSSRWRRVHPAGKPSDVRLRQVPEPPLCDFHWEAFLHREAIPVGWCIDCELYGTLGTPSPCGHDFEPFVS